MSGHDFSKRRAGGPEPGPISSVPLLIALAVLVLHSSFFRRYTIDDAYITFTAAKNLALGYGPVFVPGERVEATSSLLWACLLAPFERAGFTSIQPAKGLGLLFAAGTIVVAVRLLKRLIVDASRTAVALTAVVIASCSPFVLWSMYGMEHGLVAFLLMLSIDLFHGETRRGSGWTSAIPIALLEAARPEGMMFVLFFIGARVLRGAVGIPSPARYLRPWFGWLLLPIAAYELWGLWFYGHLLPNTVAAKVGGSLAVVLKRGVYYVLHDGSASMFWLFVATLAALLLLILRGVSAFRAGAIRDWFIGQFTPLLLLGVVSIQLLFTVLVGGDWMPHARFLSHVAPLAVVACATVVLSQARLLRLAAACAAIGFAAYNAQATRTVVRGAVGQLQSAEDRALGGALTFLNEAASATDAVACSDVGRVGYAFKGRVIDWWGLADEEIARSGQALGQIRAETVLRRKPRFIVLYSNAPELSDTSMQEGMAVYSRPFMRSEEFRRTYRPVFTVEFDPRRYHVIFERLDAR
jgi:hypothetical protein